MSKLLGTTKDPSPVTMSQPSKRMMGAPHSVANSSLIGGQPPQGDPYRTTAQVMNEGETERKAAHRKKMMTELNPEQMISPITGEQIANYGTWAEDLKNQRAMANQPEDDDEEDEQPPDDDPIMTKLRNQLAMRGAKGIVGLARLFKIMDDDRSNSLNIAEFRKAMKEFNMMISDGELITLFRRFGM